MTRAYQIAKSDLLEIKKKLLRVVDHIFIMYHSRESGNDEKPAYDIFKYTDALSLFNDGFELLLEALEEKS